MAKIKISEVGITPRTPNTPNVEGATLPLGIATQFGKAVGSLGKVIEDIAVSTRVPPSPRVPTVGLRGEMLRHFLFFLNRFMWLFNFLWP